MCVQYMKSRMIIECNPWTGGLGHWDTELNARLRIPSPFLSCCKLCFASRQLSRWQAYVYPLACGWMLPTSLPEITWQGKKRIKRVFNSYIYIYYKVVDQNSFIPERPFFANKNSTFAKLSRTPCVSFAGPMLANNTSYEDSFTTCQITPENHGSLLGSLLNMQLASRNPFSGHIFFAKFTGPPPSTCPLTFARSFA